MKLNLLVCAALVMGLAGTGVSSAIADEGDPPSPAVAAKITAAVKAVYPDAVISKIGSDSEDGLNFFEVSLAAKGTHVDMNVMADGTVVETEERVEISALPEKAAAALAAVTKGMTIRFTEIATTYAVADKNDSSGDKAVKLDHPTIAYEQAVKTDTKKGSFAVDANGKILESPSWFKAP